MASHYEKRRSDVKKSKDLAQKLKDEKRRFKTEEEINRKIVHLKQGESKC
jgi:uncharacterized protein YllA (UPF0747 family)